MTPYNNGSNLGLGTDGGNIVLDSSVLSADAPGSVNVTINGGSFSIGSALFNANVVMSESVTFGASGGTEIVGTPGSFVNPDLLTTSSPVTLSSPNDVIDDASLAFGGPLSYTIAAVGGNDQVFVSNGTNNLTFDIAGTNPATGTTPGGPLHLSSDGIAPRRPGRCAGHFDRPSRFGARLVAYRARGPRAVPLDRWRCKSAAAARGWSGGSGNSRVGRRNAVSGGYRGGSPCRITLSSNNDRRPV